MNRIRWRKSSFSNPNGNCVELSNELWRKSSYSHANGNCVELSSALSRVRDSKNPQGPTLRVDVVALLSAVKADHLAR